VRWGVLQSVKDCCSELILELLLHSGLRRESVGPSQLAQLVRPQERRHHLPEGLTRPELLQPLTAQHNAPLPQNLNLSPTLPL